MVSPGPARLINMNKLVKKEFKKMCCIESACETHSGSVICYFEAILFRKLYFVLILLK